MKIVTTSARFDLLQEDMDVNAGAVLTEAKSLDAIGHEILDMIDRVVGGRKTASEALGHCEYTLSYRGELTEGCVLQ